MKGETPINEARKSNWAEMSDQKILDYTPESLDYDARLKFREQLQQIRKRDGWNVAYTKDIWPGDGYMLKMFLEDNEGKLNPVEMFFQEKSEYYRRLSFAWAKAKREGGGEEEKKKLDEFYEKYWDEEVDDAEDTRRYKGKSSENPITNSPAGGRFEHLDSGRKKDSFWSAYSTPEEERTEEQRKLLAFVGSLPEDISVLDLGCGLGSAFVRGLQGIGKLKPGNRTNIDLDPLNIEEFKKHSVSEVGVSLVADARNIPLPDESQDLIVCNMMLADNYLNQKDQGKILKEIVRVLKTKGYLVGSLGFASKILQAAFDKMDAGPGQVYQKK